MIFRDISKMAYLLDMQQRASNDGNVQTCSLVNITVIRTLTYAF